MFPIFFLADNSEQTFTGQRIAFTSIIYYMILSSRIIDIFVQDRFRFEFAIRISGWARMVCADNFWLKS